MFSQNVKRNKDGCIKLMENIHAILYVIIDLHVKSETPGSLPPVISDRVGKFTEYFVFHGFISNYWFNQYRTLHKIHTFLEAQQDGNKIKNFFRQNEMNTLRKDCQAGLEDALTVFKVNHHRLNETEFEPIQVDMGLIIASNMAEMQNKTHIMHQELLELVEDLSDGSISDRSSSVCSSTSCIIEKPLIWDQIYQSTTDLKNRWEDETIWVYFCWYFTSQVQTHSLCYLHNQRYSMAVKQSSRTLYLVLWRNQPILPF